MKALQSLKTALVTGVLVVLPAWLALLLLLQLLVKLGVIVKPIAGHLPKGINHPTLIALAAFLIEEHEGGLSTVFMPSVPTPMAGGIFIMPSERVRPVDVSVATMMKCISKWGTGSSEILAKLDPAMPEALER